MRRYHFIILLSLLIAPPVNALDLVQDRINLENSITSQLKNELNSILPPDSFAVFTSVELNIVKVRELTEGEQIKSKAPAQESVPVLPGFLPSAEREEGSEQERQAYTMKEKLEAAKVSVRVLFDDGLMTHTIDIAKSTITERLRASFGNKATAQFETVDLVAGRKQIVGTDLASLLKKYWWVLLALLGILIFLFYFFHRKQKTEQVVAKPDNPMEQDSGIRKDSQPLAPPLQEKTDTEDREQKPVVAVSVPPLSITLKEFIEGISAHPLIARNFLKKLDSKNKNLLYSCFETSSLRDALGSILGISEEDGTRDRFEGTSVDETDYEKKVMMSNIHQEFQQYRKLIELQLQQKFGFLSLLTGDEITRLLPRDDNETLPLVMKYLPKDISKQILNALSSIQKKILLQQLTRNEQTPEGKVDQIESLMKERVSRLSQEILMPYAKNESLMDIIIEESRDTNELLSDLLKSDESLRDKYRHYLLGIDDFLEQNPTLINDCLENLPNEAVALALMGLEPPQREKLQGILPVGRRKVISALLVSYREGASPEEIETAKKQMVQIFRRRIAKSSPL